MMLIYIIIKKLLSLKIYRQLVSIKISLFRFTEIVYQLNFYRLRFISNNIQFHWCLFHRPFNILLNTTHSLPFLLQLLTFSLHLLTLTMISIYNILLLSSSSIISFTDLLSIGLVVII